MKLGNYTRLLNLWLAALVALLLLGVTGYAAAQTPTPEPSTTQQAPPHPFLPELQGVPKEELFSHFRGSEFTIADAQGNAVTYVVTPGRVASVGTGTVSVTPNGQTTAMTFMVTQETFIHAMPERGSLDALTQDDQVVVLSRQGSGDAVFIAKVEPMKYRYEGMPGGMHGWR